jgi:hypothetical protein
MWRALEDGGNTVRYGLCYGMWHVLEDGGNTVRYGLCYGMWRALEDGGNTVRYGLLCADCVLAFVWSSEPTVTRRGSPQEVLGSIIFMQTGSSA